MPLSYRREVADLIFLYKCLHGHLDVDFSSELSFIASTSGVNLRSRDSLQLLSPHANTEKFKASYFNRIVNLWNSLPYNVRSCDRLCDFKCCISTIYSKKVESFDIDNSATWSSSCRYSS